VSFFVSAIGIIGAFGLLFVLNLTGDSLIERFVVLQFLMKVVGAILGVLGSLGCFWIWIGMLWYWVRLYESSIIREVISLALMILGGPFGATLFYFVVYRSRVKLMQQQVSLV